MVQQRIADQVALDATAMNQVVVSALSGKKETLESFLKEIRPHG